MKILFTGGGTGGHFYPIIAVAEEVNKQAEDMKVLDLKLYYMADSEYNKRMLYENNLIYEEVSAGKRRTYASGKNITDMIKTAVGVVQALFKLFFLYPDVVFSKGGYAAFPTLVAARILRIPVFIHESDSVPGRVSLWASKFAKRIALSHAGAAEHFSKEAQSKIAWTGQPIRKEIEQKATSGMFEFFKLDPTIPVIFVTGGSLGAEVINNAIIDSLPELLNSYQILHQCGTANMQDVAGRSQVVAGTHPNFSRYKVFGSLGPIEIKNAAGAASLIISRAGSALFEIAVWGVPSIIIPGSAGVFHGDHQRINAFTYARSGGCVVIEEENLRPTLLLQEIQKILTDDAKKQKMIEGAASFARKDASAVIARELLSMALSHEK